MLTIDWTDGNTFVPVSSNLQSFEKEINRYCEVNCSFLPMMSFKRFDFHKL